MNDSTEDSDLTRACPCGSSLRYAECCGRLHRDSAWAETAEQLMRSRFSAYVLRDETYLWQTWDPVTRPVKIDLSEDDFEWIRLEILTRKKGMANDRKGVVEFKAYFRSEGKEQAMQEISHFRKVDNRWLYRNGAVQRIGEVAKKISPERNAPCLCGSGIKYKRCCGAA